MSGECPAARELAVSMARSWLAALDLDCPGDVIDVPEPLVQLLIPAAEVVTETRARAEEISARLDGYASAVAGLLLREAEANGELDIPDYLPARWPGDG